MSAEELRASINRAAGMPPSGGSTPAALRRVEGELDRCHRESARLDLELTKARMANQALLADAARPGWFVARDGGHTCLDCAGEIRRGEAYELVPGEGPDALRHVHCRDHIEGATE